MSRWQFFLARKHPFCPGSDPAGVRDPLSLPHLEFFYRSDSIVGLADGANITGWADQSPNNRGMGNVGNGFPLWRANASPNGLGLVGLDTDVGGNGAFLGAAPTALTSARGFSLYVWFRRTATDTQGAFQPFGPTFNDGNGHFIIFEDSGANFWPGPPPTAHFDWRRDGLFATAATDCGPVDINRHYCSLVLPAGGTGGNLRMDGGPVGLQNQSWGLLDGNGYLIQIGQNNNAQFSSRLQLGAYIGFSDTHSLSTRMGIEQFMKQTWG